MTLDDRDEAVAVLRAALTALQAAVPTQTGRTGALFRYACGDLLAQAPTLIASGAVDTTPLITHRFPLAETEAALTLARRDARSLKAVVEPHSA